jgi:hypothetical protein
MWESFKLSRRTRLASLAVKRERVNIAAWPKPSLSPMGRDRQRSSSPRGRHFDGRSQEHEYERRRDRSRDPQSSTHRDEEYDSRRRQRIRDRSRGRSSDDEDRREKSKRCVTMHLKHDFTLTNPLKAEEGQIRGTQGFEGGEEEVEG